MSLGSLQLIPFIQSAQRGTISPTNNTTKERQRRSLFWGLMVVERSYHIYPWGTIFYCKKKNDSRKYVCVRRLVLHEQMLRPYIYIYGKSSSRFSLVALFLLTQNQSKISRQCESLRCVFIVVKRKSHWYQVNGQWVDVTDCSVLLIVSTILLNNNTFANIKTVCSNARHKFLISCHHESSLVWCKRLLNPIFRNSDK